MADYWLQQKPLTQVTQMIRGIRAGRTRDLEGSANNSQPGLVEKILLYPSYCVQTLNSSHPFNLHVRGWLYSPGAMGKRNRLMIATAERIVGSPVSRAFDNSDGSDLKSGATDSMGDLLIDFDSDDRPNRVPPPLPQRPGSSRASSRSESPAVSAGSATAATAAATTSFLRERMAAVLHKSLGDREIAIDIDGGLESERIYAVTDEAGRIDAFYPLDFQPTRVVVSSSETSSSIEPIILSPRGVTVISDIDDTIRHTGVTGGKREVLQNVLVKGFGDVRLEGISEWYRHMEERGAAFHYVSNSPWQLYEPIVDFLAFEKFPVGTLHLKQYQGILNGLMEPVVSRKKTTLERIARDFPQRQFILVGDSGEADLEAYVRMALDFPSQVLAIYIRDITLPPDVDLSEALPVEVESQAVGDDLIDLSTPQKTAPPVPPKPAHLVKRKPVPDPVAVRDEAMIYQEQKSSNAQGVGEAFMGLGVRNAAKVVAASAASSAIERASRKMCFESPQPQHSEQRPPPLPPRVRQSPEHSVSEANPMVISSAQDYLDYDPDKLEGVEKQIYLWKRRLRAARKALPDEIKLRVFRSPSEVESESLNLIRKQRLL